MCAISASTVALLYCTWRAHHQKREKRLRERVAYMLWVMANGVEMK